MEQANPTDRPDSPGEFTARAVVTGMLLGAALTPCNVYSGLKIGWSFNMSIAAGLLAVGAWRLAEKGTVLGFVVRAPAISVRLGKKQWPRDLMVS